ncbi:MAG: hypothetical protein NXH87_04215 [Rhodobiaceae bacterium]|nr:hypothetical protein [Rhodobiaceae bacterium]
MDEKVDVTAGKLFLSRMPNAFDGRLTELHTLRQKVAKKFRLNIRDVLFCGSGHLGYSLVKDKEFSPDRSDLDLAIVNSRLFYELLEVAAKVSNGYSNRSMFPRVYGEDGSKYFVESAARKGMIHPDYLPTCQTKVEWRDFFREVSNDFQNSFQSVSGVVYASEFFFVQKQTSAVAKKAINR